MSRSLDWISNSTSKIRLQKWVFFIHSPITEIWSFQMWNIFSHHDFQVKAGRRVRHQTSIFLFAALLPARESLSDGDSYASTVRVLSDHQDICERYHSGTLHTSTVGIVSRIVAPSTHTFYNVYNVDPPVQLLRALVMLSMSLPELIMHGDLF